MTTTNTTFALLLGGAIVTALVIAYGIYSFDTNPIHDTRIDKSTYGNYHQIFTRHLHLDLTVDFDNKQLLGNVTHSMKVIDSRVKEIIFDVVGLDINGVYLDNKELNFNIDSDVPFEKQFGKRLVVELPRKLRGNELVEIVIAYATTSESAAINWLDPEQTAGGKYPYLYTQCEAIMTRSLLPVMDTPAIKLTYTAKITHPEELTALMSANLTDTDSESEGTKASSFKQDLPIPSYLLALVVGNLEFRSTGERTGVYSEPEKVDAAAAELEDLEKFLQEAENYLEVPYEWGPYNILVLPPSFPMGGMENPLLTFASPTTIVGDKSQVNVAAHEIGHSWFGNLVTNQNWESFWLNEGFTVFIERKIVKSMYGEDFYKVAAIEGNSSLYGEFENFGYDHSFTSLTPDLTEASPDDAFSTVPYEKGFQFLTYLESIIGEDVMQSLLKAYILRYQRKGTVSKTFTEFFIDHALANGIDQEALDQIDWEAWLTKPGPIPVALDFTTPKVEEARQLALDYIELNGDASPENFEIYNDYFVNLQLIFLYKLSENLDSLSNEVLARIDADYKLTSSTNPEILAAWGVLAIKKEYEEAYTNIQIFMGSNGRLKYIRPLYKELSLKNRELALQIFDEYKGRYHQLAVNQISKDLGI